jgi:hypothetical protein
MSSRPISLPSSIALVLTSRTPKAARRAYSDVLIRALRAKAPMRSLSEEVSRKAMVWRRGSLEL